MVTREKTKLKQFLHCLETIIIIREKHSKCHVCCSSRETMEYRLCIRMDNSMINSRKSANLLMFPYTLVLCNRCSVRRRWAMIIVYCVPRGTVLETIGSISIIRIKRHTAANCQYREFVTGRKKSRGTNDRLTTTPRSKRKMPFTIKWLIRLVETSCVYVMCSKNVGHLARLK